MPTARNKASLFRSSVTPLSVTYLELKSACSISVAGWILFNLNAPDLQVWGNDVIQRALTSIEAPAQGMLRCKIVQQVEANGRLGHISHERLPMGATTHHSIHSATWGVDRSSETKSPTNEQFKAAAAVVSEELERRRALPDRDIVSFNAFDPLRKWAHENKGEFSGFAFRFLTVFGALNSDRRQELANFANDVFVILLQYDSEQALTFSRKEFGELGVIDSRVGLPWTSMLVWTKGLDHVFEVERLRDTYLDEAPNDEVIFQHVLAGRRGEVDVEALARTLLQNPRAKERALAVTILAGVGTASAAAMLSELREEDPSLWIRAHARWAFQVCLTEDHCRQWYAQTLKGAPSLSQLEMRLVSMEPALTPSASIWRHQLEQDADWDKWDYRVRGHLELFWKRIEHNSFRQGSWKLLGRCLSEYCRGDSLKEGVTSQQFPWWKP